MTTEQKEICEYLAERLFGFEQDEDNKEQWYAKAESNPNMLLSFGGWCPIKPPNYFENAMPVLEKLADNMFISIFINDNKVTIIDYKIDTDIEHKGNTIHEAIVNCAYDYLKAVAV